MEKKCFKCGKVKDISNFYKHKEMKDGYLNKCKDCAKKDVSENYFKKEDKYKKYDQIRNQKRKKYIKLKSEEYQIKNKVKTNSYKKKWAEKNHLKRAAHIIIGNLLRDGKLTRGPCQICKTMENIEAHHFDYAKPFDVIWLCKEHHQKVHWWLKWNIREVKLKNK